MAVKHKEHIKRDKKQSWKIFAIIAIFTIILNIAISYLNEMENVRLAGYLSLGVLVGMLILSIKLINHSLAEYEYILTNNRFIINKVFGKRVKDSLNIALDDIEYIISKKDLDKDPSLKKKVGIQYDLKILKFINKDREEFIGYYKYQDKWGRFSFYPNEKMLKKLRNQLGKEKVKI